MADATERLKIKGILNKGMRLEEKYTNTTENKQNRIKLTDDAYAICEYIQGLTDMFDRMRRKK